MFVWTRRLAASKRWRWPRSTAPKMNGRVKTFQFNSGSQDSSSYQYVGHKQELTNRLDCIMRDSVHLEVPTLTGATRKQYKPRASCEKRRSPGRRGAQYFYFVTALKQIAPFRFSNYSALPLTIAMNGPTHQTMAEPARRRRILVQQTRCKEVVGF